MASVRGPFSLLYRVYRCLRRAARRVLVFVVPARWLREGGPVSRDKLALVDFACRRLGVTSIADLGGAWRVNGAYAVRALSKGGVERAFVVDVSPTDVLRERAAALSRLTLIKGDFTSREVAEQIGTVDAVTLFDVLLHQGDPTWEDVLELCAPRTRCFLVFNPQWVRTGETTRLLDLGREDYMRSVPLGSQEETLGAIFAAPDETDPSTGKPRRDYFGIWQWGIADDDLVAKMDSLGFELRRYRSCGRFRDFASFENHSFVFCKRPSPA